MSDKKTTFSKSFEELLNKSIEANKILINEGTQMFKRFSKADKPLNNLNIFPTGLLTKTFNEYVKMNVTHFNNLIDLGLNFVKNINNSPEEKQSSSDADSGPSFILEETTEAGKVASFKFLLDNIKSEIAKCHFICSSFILQTDPSTSRNFAAEFSPQAFELKPGESKPINISIRIPEDTVPGIYLSKVQVMGFEPAYFSVQITVTEKKSKQVADERKKAKPKRK